MKIAICIPCYADTKALFTLSLANMLLFSKDTKYILDGKRFSPDFKVFLRGSSLLLKTREDLVADALEWSADWILFLDADHTFPPHTLTRLLSHHKDVVGCNFLARQGPPRPSTFVISGDDGVGLMTTEELARNRPIEQVATVGLGLCLMKSQVFKDIERPLFTFGYVDGVLVGEDIALFNNLRRAGIAIFVDHALSWDCGHIAERVLTFGGEV